MDSTPDDGPCEVTITAPKQDWLQAFARQLVEDGLAAAAHLDSMHTTYRWNGEVHDKSEARVILHATLKNSEVITRRAIELHPYDVPCVVVIPITHGSERYLEWILDPDRS